MSDFITTILSYAPHYWDKSGDREVDVVIGSEEFNQVVYEVRKALRHSTKVIKRMQRIQNFHDLGQLLIREQLLVITRPNKKFYRVRKFIALKKQYLQTALKYNLDHRRCGLNELVFSDWVHHALLPHDSVVIIVQVVTSEPDLEVKPSNNLEYFIDYVVHF